jgi:hypothetical protein
VKTLGRISKRMTLIPLDAACQAASEPASPPPMIINLLSFIDKLIIAIIEDFLNRLDLEDITYPNSQLQMSLFSLRGFLGGSRGNLVSKLPIVWKLLWGDNFY